MSNFSGYKTKSFSETQKFFVLDPQTGSPSFVAGSDLVKQLTPNSNYVYAENTRTSAQATDYDIGSLVQTAGDTAVADNGAAYFLVVEAGAGDFPMDNGNELLFLYDDDLLRTQLADNTATLGSDLVAHTGTTDTVTEALDKRTIYVESVAEGINGLTGVDGQAYNVIGWHEDSEQGGGEFVYRASAAKSGHNGVTIISPSVPPVSSQTGTTLAERRDAFLAGTGETNASGNGVFVRCDVSIAYAENAGAFGDLSGDDWGAANAALQAYNRLFVYQPLRLDSMLEVVNNQGISLVQQGWLYRTTDTANTDPVVWLKGNYASCIGGGQYSRIISLNRAPFGVIRVGHKDLTESHGNVLYCQVKNLRVQGESPSGQTSGDLDTGIYCANPQISGVASYFHQFNNIVIQDVNIGIGLNGYANAHYFDDIHLYRVGNTYGRKGVHINGAQETLFGKLFHHSSTDSYTIVQDILDNTVNTGGTTHTPRFNTMGLIMSEQGGANARALVVNDSGTRNHYYVQANTSKGNLVPSDFFSRGNRLDTAGGVLTETLQAETVRVKKGAEYQDVKAQTGAVVLAVEGEQKELCTMTVGSKDCSYVRLTGRTRNSSDNRAGLFTYEWGFVRDAAGTITVTQIAGTELNLLAAGAISLDASANPVKFFYTPTDNGGTTETTISYTVEGMGFEIDYLALSE